MKIHFTLKNRFVLRKQCFWAQAHTALEWMSADDILDSEARISVLSCYAREDEPFTAAPFYVKGFLRA